MSELFDSLNLSTSAGPSSSQQSSSQPSTSKVFWHASPSPGVLRQLANWTPSKGRNRPHYPLCTQAFVGELKKLPGALEAQSPLIARDSAKRKKLLDTPRTASRHVSDPTRTEAGLENTSSWTSRMTMTRRVDRGDCCLETRVSHHPNREGRRTMDAGQHGQVARVIVAVPAQHSHIAEHLITLQRGEGATSAAHVFESTTRSTSTTQTQEESFNAGLGLTDDSGGTTDCLKLFRGSAGCDTGDAEWVETFDERVGSRDASSEHPRPTVTFDRGSSQGGSRGSLTPREGVNRTVSAPNASRGAQLSQQGGTDGLRSSQQGQGTAARKEDPLTPRRGLRPVKSDQDVFRPVAQTSVRPLQTSAHQRPGRSSPSA